MERINAFHFIMMGGAMSTLADHLNTRADYSFNDLALDTSSLISHLEGLAFSKAISLEVSQPLAYETTKAINVSPEYLKDHGSDHVPPDVKSQIVSNLVNFSTVLANELAACDLYFISEKRLYKTKGLIFNAEKALPDAVVKELSPECVKDIQEAGRCLAFDLPTACGFHIFRALEAVVLLYFPLLGIAFPDETEQSPPEEARNAKQKKKILRSLGIYINLLKDARVNDNIINMLNHLKEFYRNPLMHPELTLGDEEAASLFAYVTDAMTQMMRDIIQRKGQLKDDSDMKEDES